jgi:hypothetical protein
MHRPPFGKLETRQSDADPAGGYSTLGAILPLSATETLLLRSTDILQESPLNQWDGGIIGRVKLLDQLSVLSVTTL